jgi:hypothetical protein
MGFTKKQVKHEGGKGRVLGVLRKIEYGIAMIDEDPNTNPPAEIKEYREIESKNTIKLFIKKGNERKKIVQISPYLEHWLINRAKRNKIILKDFNLPANPKEMHDYPHIEKTTNFQRFIDRLIEVDDEIKTMKEWIKETID